MANSFAPDTLRQAILSQKIRESHGPSTRPFIECGTICQLRREASDLNVSRRRPVRVISQPATVVRFGSNSEVGLHNRHVRFSNRPFGVKRSQTIHHHSVDVARGLVLLFGIGTKALPSGDSRTGWNNLSGGLTVNRTTGPSGHTNSPHPSSREGHLPTARWNSSFLLSGLILNGFHAAAAAACSRVHRNSVPSTQMRCMITANRRAKATIAFFIPRRLAICMAQALSHDHLFEYSML